MKALLTVGALVAALALVACAGYHAEEQKLRFEDWPFLGMDETSVLGAQLPV